MSAREKSLLTVDCPTCKKTVEWIDENTFRPFCSKRCQLIDLGEWASESYKIPDSRPTALDEFDLEEMEQQLMEQQNDSNNPPEGGWLQ